MPSPDKPGYGNILADCGPSKHLTIAKVTYQVFMYSFTPCSLQDKSACTRAHQRPFMMLNNNANFRT